MKKIEQNTELYNFFKQVLGIPQEHLKEFIFQKKKYVKHEDIFSTEFTENLFWYVSEWRENEWAVTDTCIVTSRYKKKSPFCVLSIYEADMNKSEPFDAKYPKNESGTHLIDLE